MATNKRTQSTGGAGYQPLDADKRKKIQEQYKRERKEMLAREKAGGSEQQLKDVLYRSGTGTSGLLKAQSLNLLTPESSKRMEQDVLAHQLARSKNTFATGKRDTSLSGAIVQGREQRRLEQKSQPSAQTSSAYSSMQVPSMSDSRGFQYDPSSGSLSPYRDGTRSGGEYTGTGIADQKISKLYQDVEAGTGFEGTKDFHPRQSEIDELKAQQKKLMSKGGSSGMSESDWIKANKDVERQLDKLRAIPMQKTEEFEKWQSEQGSLADRARGELARGSTPGGGLEFGQDATAAANRLDGAFEFPGQQTSGQAQPTTQTSGQGAYGYDAGAGRTSQYEQGQVNINPYTGEPSPGGAQAGGGQAGTDMYQAQINQQLGGAAELANIGSNMAQTEYDYKQGATRDQLLMSLQGTDFFGKAKSLGYNPNTMSVDEIRGFLGQNGYEVSGDDMNRIQASGASMMDNLLSEKNDAFAQIDMTRKQIEREYGRALDDVEQQNLSSDNAMKKMLAAFGGGKVESMAGNMEVMRVQERGQRMKNDLLADFGDKQTTLSLQANQVLRSYTQNVNNVQQYMAEEQNKLYSEISTKVDGLIDQGITNTTDLIKALGETDKEYVKKTMEINQKGFELIDEHNKWLANYDIKIRADQRAEDDQMMDAYGMMYKNGRPMLDQAGNQIPTMDGMKFANDVDKQMSTQTGFMYHNGQPLLDSSGNMVPTYSREQAEAGRQFDQYKFETQEGRLRAGQQQSAFESNRNYNLQVEKFMQDGRSRQEASQLAREEMRLDMIEKGYQPVDPPQGFRGGMQETTADLQKSNYGAQMNPDGGININIQAGATGDQLPDQRWDGRKLNKGAYQCGEFVNDVFGTGVMGDSIGSKLKKVVTNMPTAGSAFVQRTQGPYGHTGIVESVEMGPDGRPTSMQIVDVNSRSSGQVKRDTVEITYDQNGNPKYSRNGSNMAIEGYTSSMTGQPAAGMITPDNSDMVSLGGQTYKRPGAGVPGSQQDISIEKMSEPQRASFDFAKRMDQAEAIMTNTIPKLSGEDLAFGRGLGNIPLIGGLTGAAKSENLKKQEQAERSFVNAVLRKESGAAISDTEFESAKQQYFPSYGDTPDVLDQKRKNREMVMSNMFQSAGQYSRAGGGQAGTFGGDSTYNQAFSDIGDFDF